MKDSAAGPAQWVSQRADAPNPQTVGHVDETKGMNAWIIFIARLYVYVVHE